jgi:carbon monoxide dehydrogenase subunit G
VELEHRFTVPVDVEHAWAHFQDIGAVAECFPGAQVTDHEGDTFHGSVKVKLGPIALVYNGMGTFTEKDEAAHRFVVDAKGKDKRGNGTAGATVTLAMTGSGGSTDVAVHTDLAITGKPAQFGRGVMQDVSDKLLGQFVACLEQRLSEDEGTAAAAAPAPAAAEPPGPVAASAPAAAEAPVATGADEAVAAETPEAAAAPPPPAVPAEEPPAAEATPAPAASAAAASAAAASAPAPAEAAAAPAPATRPRGSDDALDLGKTVLPILVRTYWKPVLVLLVVIVVLLWLFLR